MDWSKIAMPTGSPASGALGIAVTYTLPPARGDLPATQIQRDAVLQFFTREFGDITSDQANTLLACRDFARRSADKIFKGYPEPFRRLVSPPLAAFLLADERSVEFVQRWADAAFRRGSASPRVAGAPIFPEMKAFADYLEGMIQMEGWTREAFKGLR